MWFHITERRQLQQYVLVQSLVGLFDFGLSELIGEFTLLVGHRIEER